MEPRFEDILHLVSYNGYAEDTRRAVAVNRDTWTDERIWQPFLMDQQFGPKKKGRLQILAENKRIYEHDTKLLARLEALKKFAEVTHHMKRFRKQVNIYDTDGESALTAAIQTRCPNVVQFLIENGADINQTNKKGRSALNLAKVMEKENDEDKQHEVIKGWNGRVVIGSVRQKRSEFIVSYLTGLGAVDIPEEVQNVIYHRYIYEPPRMRYMDLHMNMDLHMRIDRTYNMIHRLYVEPEPGPPKPKRMKTSLYKQQFGKHR